MGVGPDVKHHQCAEAAALRRPTRAEGVARPGGGRTGDGAAQGDETDASVREVGQGCAIDDFVRSIVLTIKDDDLVLVVLSRKDVTRTVRFGHHGAGGGELGDERFDGGRVVGDDGHLERGGAKDGGGTGQSEAQERGDAGKHGVIKRSLRPPTTLRSIPNRNPTPLKCTFPADCGVRPRPGSARGRARSTS